MASSKKSHINLVVMGNLKHGKSTLLGRLLYEIGTIPERIIKEYKEKPENLGEKSSMYAWVLEKLKKEERERGLTIDLGFYKFETKKHFFTLIDVSGNENFFTNMAAGASQADAAVLVVSAKEGEFEAGISPAGQTREHVFLAKTMGVDQLMVCINKMDIVDYSKERYEEIKNTLRRLLRMIGYKVDEIAFIPTSAWYGDNVTKKSNKTPWYDGPTMLEAFDNFKEPPRPIYEPLRISILDVYSNRDVGTVTMGRVVTGVLKVDDTVVFMPSNVKGKVKSIEMHNTKIKQAIPGDIISFNVEGVSKDQISRGEVAGDPSNPPTVAQEFVGQIFVLGSRLTAREVLNLHVHTTMVPVRVVDIEKKFDPRTGMVIGGKYWFIEQGDVAEVRFKPLKPVVIENFNEISRLGRFAISANAKLLASGFVISVKPKEII